MQRGGDVRSAVSDAPSLASSVGQLHVEKDARVGSSELADSDARGKLSPVEAPDEGAGALHKPMNMEANMPEECPLAVEAFPEHEGVTVGPLSTLAETGPEPFPRLEVEEATTSVGRGRREGLKPYCLFGDRCRASGADLGAARFELDIWAISLMGMRKLP